MTQKKKSDDKGEGGVKNCEKIDDAKEIKGVDKEKGGVKKSEKLVTSFMDGPKLHFGVMGMTPAYPHAICPTSKTKVGQLLRIAEFCF